MERKKDGKKELTVDMMERVSRNVDGWRNGRTEGET